jgi:hypothetical protein
MFLGLCPRNSWWWSQGRDGSRRSDNAIKGSKMNRMIFKLRPESWRRMGMGGIKRNSRLKRRFETASSVRMGFDRNWRRNRSGRKRRQRCH